MTRAEFTREAPRAVAAEFTMLLKAALYDSLTPPQTAPQTAQEPTRGQEEQPA